MLNEVGPVQPKLPQLHSELFCVVTYQCFITGALPSNERFLSYMFVQHDYFQLILT